MRLNFVTRVGDEGQAQADALFLDELGEENIKSMYYIMGRNLIRKIRLTGDSPYCDNINTADKVESFDDNIKSAFTATVDTLVAMYGDSPASWKWGELHKISLIHPMGSVDIVNKLFKTNRGPYAVGGSFHTVSPYAYPARKSFVADHGASERHIFDLSDWDESLTIIPTGNSGVPASPHYLDQTELFINKGLHADHFSREAVENNALYKTIVK